MVRLICFLPAVSLAIQLPLWAARFWFQWQFVRGVTSTNPATDCAISNPQLTLREMLLTTAIIATTLAITRLAQSPSQAGAMANEFWVGIGLFGAAAATLSCFSILPLMMIFARVRSLPLAWCLALGYGFVAETTFLVIFYSGLFGWRLTLMDFFGNTMTMVCLAAGIAGGLTLLRMDGVHLQRGRG